MQIFDWIYTLRTVLEPGTTLIPWSENREWIFDHGKLTHTDNAFFSVVGVQVNASGNLQTSMETPMIDQSEIGLLGFVVCEEIDNVYWLLQAKLEPGSVDFVQAAPTVQATESNYKRKHGGSETRYLELFHDINFSNLVDTLQSEQGSRFIGKYNRNAVKLVPSRFTPPNHTWKWFPASDLQEALLQDFMINTDARSVITSAPWRLLSRNGTPFSGPHSSSELNKNPAIESGTLASLSMSYQKGSADIKPLLNTLIEQSENNHLSIIQVPLESMKCWKITSNSIYPVNNGAEFVVESYSIFAPGREVEHWHQPLVRSMNQHRCDLLFQQRDGMFKVFLRFSSEPGFGTKVQYGPSYQSDGKNPDWLKELLPNLNEPFASILQSDEGGRFINSIVRYSLHLIRNNVDLDDSGGVWVDMQQLEALCLRSGVLTNEARSAVSLLLSYA